MKINLYFSVTFMLFYCYINRKRAIFIFMFNKYTGVSYV